jgi:hypothetical protein
VALVKPFVQLKIIKKCTLIINYKNVTKIKPITFDIRLVYLKFDDFFTIGPKKPMRGMKALKKEKMIFSASPHLPWTRGISTLKKISLMEANNIN